MGILFNLLVAQPYYRWATRRNADWKRRKAAGEKVFPLKPDTVVILTLIIITVLIAIIGSLS